MLVKICANRWIDRKCIQSLTVLDYENESHDKDYLIIVGGVDYEGKSFEGVLQQQYPNFEVAINAMDTLAKRINQEKE